jgi:hypothetical protein
MRQAVDTENWEFLSLLLVCGALEYVHEVQAHQPATVRERVQRLVSAVAGDGSAAPVPVPVRARLS